MALITDTFVPQVNGVSTVLQRMTTALSTAGHHVAMVAPRYPDHPSTDTAQRLRIPSVAFPPYPDIRLSAPLLGRIDRFLDAVSPDLLHVATEGPLGFAGRRYALRRRRPLVTSFHTDFPRYCRDYGVGALEPLVWRWLAWFHGPAAVTQTPGEHTRDLLRSRGFGTVMVWGRGVDVQLFHPQHRSAAVRRRLNVRDDQLMIIHVGRLAPEKNIPILLDAWEAARESLGDRAVFVIAGDGPMHALVRERAPWAAVTGFLRRVDLAALYASADLCVLPSTTETCGLVALEAMASGLPVIAANAGGFAESVRDGENGLLVPPRDTRATAAAIIQLALEDHRRQEMRTGARRWAEQRDLRIEDQQLIDLYHQLIGSPRRAPLCLAV